MYILSYTNKTRDSSSVSVLISIRSVAKHVAIGVEKHTTISFA